MLLSASWTDPLPGLVSTEQMLPGAGGGGPRSLTRGPCQLTPATVSWLFMAEQRGCKEQTRHAPRSGNGAPACMQGGGEGDGEAARLPLFNGGEEFTIPAG